MYVVPEPTPVKKNKIKSKREMLELNIVGGEEPSKILTLQTEHECYKATYPRPQLNLLTT